MITADTICDYPSLEASGLSMRSSTDGPEIELVRQYAQFQLPPAPPRQLQTVFLEPRIESGFPDIVVVYWDASIAATWSKDRANLTKTDIRVLHYLAIGGEGSPTELQRFFSKNVTKSLKRLYSSGLIKWTSGIYETEPLHKIFAVQRLVAIEAKISKWQQGLRQAFQNTWFASESYLLLPSIPQKTKLIREARHLGIGVVAHYESINDSNVLANTEEIPKSYASWLFNEWAWKAKFNDYSV